MLTSVNDPNAWTGRTTARPKRAWVRWGFDLGRAETTVEKSTRGGIMFDWIFGDHKGKQRGKPGIGAKPPYEEAREIAGSGEVEARRRLAAHEDLEPEILYYFASDRAPEVRREVAQNVGTPLQADAILARDPNDEVRCELARKISRLLPEYTPETNAKLAEIAMQILNTLARDELPRVRATIAEELKHSKDAPEEIVHMLAEDLEDIVAAPILEYSPLLSGEDLLRLIASGLKIARLTSIARRRHIEVPVIDALVETENSETVQTVLENETADISEKSYHKITKLAPSHINWHHAMVNRDDLPLSTIHHIARFVNAALMENLIRHHRDQKELVDELRTVVSQRIENSDLPEPEGAPTDDGYLLASDRVEKDFEAGRLHEERLHRALEEDDKTYVRYALSKLSGYEIGTASKMLNTSNAKAIVALSWKAGLSMAMAEMLQLKIGRIKQNQVQRADKGGGYPMTEDEMEWYLESFI